MLRVERVFCSSNLSMYQDWKHFLDHTHRGYVWSINFQTLEFLENEGLRRMRKFYSFFPTHFLHIESPPDRLTTSHWIFSDIYLEKLTKQIMYTNIYTFMYTVFKYLVVQCNFIKTFDECFSTVNFLHVHFW